MQSSWWKIQNAIAVEKHQGMKKIMEEWVKEHGDRVYDKKLIDQLVKYPFTPDQAFEEREEHASARIKETIRKSREDTDRMWAKIEGKEYVPPKDYTLDEFGVKVGKPVVLGTGGEISGGLEAFQKLWKETGIAWIPSEPSNKTTPIEEWENRYKVKPTMSHRMVFLDFSKSGGPYNMGKDEEILLL